jgi:hypothetical protein
MNLLPVYPYRRTCTSFARSAETRVDAKAWPSHRNLTIRLKMPGKAPCIYVEIDRDIVQQVANRKYPHTLTAAAQQRPRPERPRSQRHPPCQILMKAPKTALPAGAASDHQGGHPRHANTRSEPDVRAPALLFGAHVARTFAFGVDGLLLQRRCRFLARGSPLHIASSTARTRGL